MATAIQLSWNELVFIAERIGVTNWRGPNGVAGRLILAPSSHRGSYGSMGSVVGCVRHHTGTPETYQPTQDYPTYGVVKEGRAGLENSLSAYGLGRWYGLYVFSEFISWHAGVWNWQGITDGNGHFLGIEAEGTGAVWTLFQQEFYPRLCASILSYCGEGIDMMPRHLDGAMPRGRKNDAANLWSTFTTRVQWMLDDPKRITYGYTPVTPIQPLQTEDHMPYLLRAETGSIFYIDVNTAEPVTKDSDNLALQARWGKPVTVSVDLFNRTVAAARSVARATGAIEQDLADEEPSSVPPPA